MSPLSEEQIKTIFQPVYDSMIECVESYGGGVLHSERDVALVTMPARPCHHEGKYEHRAHVWDMDLLTVAYYWCAGWKA